MAFKHDSQGFLVGELLDVNRELLDGQSAGMTVWRGIRSDVKAIARALGVQVRTSKSQQRSAAATASQPGSTQARDASGRFIRKIATPAGRTGNGAARAAATPGAQRTAASTEQKNRAATVTPGGRASRGASIRSASADDVDTRDALGRFTAGQGRNGGSGSRGGDGGGGASDRGESDGSGRLTNTLEKLVGTLDGADQLDPTVMAMKEIKDAVSPLGRGMFSMFGRGAERKKEVWYKRILKAITGKKDSAGGSMGGGESVKSGSFMGTMMGELLSKATLFVAPLLAGLGSLLLGGLGLLGAAALGSYVGTKIYEWLDKSGIAAKIFDAFDAVTGWLKEKYQQVTGAVKTVANDFKTGAKEQSEPVKYVPSVLDQSGRNINDPRRTDRVEAVTADGRMINDPRRLDSAPMAELPPATSMAQRTGRFVGGIKQLFKRGSSQQRALETGASYAAGNIGGLNDAQTRALVASTALTESGGGKTGIVNDAGYMGRYQAGAGWLADAGLIKGGSKGVKAAMAKDGFTNEYKWGKSGGMTKFLKNDDNWGGGLNYQSYLKSPEAQDLAFKTNSDAAYTTLMNDPTITDKSPENMAGLLKARHLGGLRGARAVAQGGTGAVDSNGTSVRKYYDDVAKDRNGFLGAFSGAPTLSAGAARIPPVVIPSSTPERIAPAPDAAVPAQLNTTKQAPVNVSMREAIGQDVGDRSIAHVVSGGLGMMA